MKKIIRASAMLILVALLAMGAAGCATQVYVLPNGRWRAAVNGVVGEVVAPYLEFQMDNAMYDSFEDSTYTGKLLLEDGWQRVTVELTEGTLRVIDVQGNTLLSGAIQSPSNVAATRQFLLKPEVDNIFNSGAGGLQFVYDHNPGSDYSYVEQSIPSLSTIDMLQVGVRGSIKCIGFEATDVSGIRIDVYERTDGTGTLRYFTSVYTDRDGAFEFKPNFVNGVLRISTDLLPEGYGLVLEGDNSAEDGEWSTDFVAGSEVRIKLDRIDGVALEAVLEDGDIELVMYCVGSLGGNVVGNIPLSGRFEDSFVEDMISGNKFTYHGKVVIGENEFELDTTADPTKLFADRAERLKYLYDRNYIDEARYGELTKR